MFLLEIAVTGNFFVFIEKPTTENSWFPACQLKHKNFYRKKICESIVLINIFCENKSHFLLNLIVF